jgi:hypothetical protein
MYPTIRAMLSDVRFYGLLLKFDQDLAATVRSAGCPACGAALHAAPYPRKPRGGPAGLGPEHRQRLSLCCAADGCRQRSTPPSVRFLGPKVYWGAAVVVISAMSCGPTPARMHQLHGWVGVSRRTVARWRDWWCEVFANTPFWRAAAWIPPVAAADLPAALLERFAQHTMDPLTSLLRFLTPLTVNRVTERAM